MGVELCEVAAAPGNNSRDMAKHAAERTERVESVTAAVGMVVAVPG